MTANTQREEEDLKRVRELLGEYNLLTAEQVAECLNVSQSHLANMRRQPDEAGLHVTYIGSRSMPRYTIKAVREFIEQGGTPSARSPRGADTAAGAGG